MNDQHEQLLKTLSELPWGKELLTDYCRTPEGEEIESPPAAEEPSADEPVQIVPSTPLTPEQARLLESVRVPVQVELAHLHISVEQLLDLVPGQSFPYELPRQTVTLCLNGSKIAEARLVRREGTLALHILAVGKKENGEQEAAFSRTLL
jgi:flagellar motor switch/type III secretory pathway protein FliN